MPAIDGHAARLARCSSPTACPYYMSAEETILLYRFHSSNRSRWARHRPLSSARRSSFVGVPALPLFALGVSVVWWDGQAGAPPFVLSLRCAFGRAVPALSSSKAAACSRRATLRRIWVRKIAPFGRICRAHLSKYHVHQNPDNVKDKPPTAVHTHP